MDSVEIITESAVALLVAIIGFVAGLLVEKKRHNLEIQTIGLNLSVEAYQKLLAAHFDLMSATGKLVNVKKSIDERKSLSESMKSALNALFNASYNPFISSDSKVIESRNIANECVAIIDTNSRSLSNGDDKDYLFYSKISTAQDKLVKDNELLCKYVSSKYAVIMPNELKKSEINRKRINFIINSFYTHYVMRFKNDE